MVSILFFCGLYLSQSTLAQKMSSEPCPTVTVQQDFQEEDYLGLWYEYARSNSIFEQDAKCVFMEYSDNHNGSYKIINTVVNDKTNLPLSIVGEVKVVSDNREAKMTVKFPQAPFPGSFWVLETDYTSYSVVWGCNDFVMFSTRLAWIITRERKPPQEIIDTAYSVLDRNHIDRNILEVTNQDDCGHINKTRNFF